MGTALPVRELYCPSHFGNEYESAMDREMRETLAEARFWGFNRYSDWFDTIDLYDLYARGRTLFNLPEAVWERKFANFAVAADLGFELGLVVTPNHVFSDQVTPATAAVTGGRYFGQLVCPHRPGVTDLVRRNYRNLFAEFAQRGLRLGTISAGAYDYGGCACEACRPWIVSFGKLFLEILAEAEAVFGTVNADLWAWWWTDEDHEAFAAWADRQAPKRFSALANHILYGESRYKVRRLPAACSERAFTHIGYGEKGGIDVYGHYGPTVAARRLQATYEFLAGRGASGFLAYSEGTFDEVNKAIMAGLASAQYASASDVLEAYAERHFGGDARGWADWLTAMGDVETLDPLPARRDFDLLARQARPSERLQSWAQKLAMREADAAVRQQPAWDTARLAAAEAFWAAKERLWRGLWRRGLCRHIFRFDWKVPAWHAEYVHQSRRAPLAVATGPAPKEA